MRMIHCPNCGKLTGFKRSLGFGTFFMVLLTCGLWLLVIPFYPVRCINCGLTRSTAVRLKIGAWFRGLDGTRKAWIVGTLALAFLLLIFEALPDRTPSGVTDNAPRLSKTASAANASPAIAAGAAKPTQPNDVSQDRELHLLPNAFGNGAVSDGRTYSIALISAYQGKIPPATELFVQGIILEQAGENAVTLGDEQDQGKTLVCDMSPQEFQEVASLYHVGDRVQAEGLYGNTSNGMLLRNCRVASPTDMVVRPANPTPSPVQPAAPGDPKTASISKAAEQGDAYAQSTLGFMFDKGQGVAQDYAQAVYWYRKAAEQGYANAQYNLGVMFEKGHGVPQDYARAFYWYRKAAEQGDANAECNLSGMYQNGEGVLQDYGQAVFWDRKAAEKGVANAQDSLGSRYLLGQGVPRDYAQAAYWYRKAADQGYAKGQYNLGVMYYNGQGVPLDYGQALYWYHKAADQDYADAEYNIGVMYEKGQGVPQNSAQASYWYRKANEK
jgi:TPR repeat protein